MLSEDIVQLELTAVVMPSHMQRTHWPDKTPDMSTRRYLRVLIIYRASLGQYTTVCTKTIIV